MSEFFAKGARQQDDADLSFERNLCAAAARCFGGDVAQLTDTDAAGTEGLHNEGETFFAGCAGDVEQALVFCARKLAAVVAKKLVLHTQELDAQGILMEKAQKAIEGNELVIDGGWLVAGCDELLLPGLHGVAGKRSITKPGCEGANMAQIILDGAGTALFTVQMMAPGDDGGIADGGLDHGGGLLLLFLSILPPTKTARHRKGFSFCAGLFH